MAHAIHEQFDTLLWRHLLEMEVEREDDARATMHAPEEHTDLLLGRLREAEVPQQQLPVKRIAFSPERRAEDRAIRLVTRGHEALQVMAGNQLVMDSRA